jgi:histidine triad (HIT) family protein
MPNPNNDAKSCPFCAILRGDEPGNVIARDDVQRFALIQSTHPEATIHWMAVPYDHVVSTEVMEHEDSARFLALVDFALTQAKIAVEDYPALQQGFSLKVHFGSFETVPHAKLHILSKE